MDSNELQRFIDSQDFKHIGSDEIQTIIDNVLATCPIKGINMQYKEQDGMHFMLVQFRDNSGTKCRGAFQFALNTIAQNICDQLDEISDQLIAIESLNVMISDKQYQSDNQFSVSYCWGSDNKCSVEDWSYQYIKIKLSKDSCEKLRLLVKDDSDQLQRLTNETDFGLNAAETVSNFNNMALNQEMAAILWTSQVEKALTSNMISTDDAIEYIREQNSKAGIQHIKVVIPFNELGQFLVVTDWTVDYSDRSIKQVISEQKLLDVENRKYILDSSIYSRVEKRVNLSKETITEMFSAQQQEV